MRGLLFLALAVASEVAATLALKASAPVPRPTVLALVTLGYVTAFACLWRSLGSLPVGVAYALWAGAGTAGVALLGGWLFGETLPGTAWLGICLVVGGVAILGAVAPAP